MDPTAAVAAAGETAVPVLPFPSPSNGASPSPGQIDPSTLLLVQEIRRGQDAMRKDLVDEVRGLREDMRSVRDEVRQLRDGAPNKLSFYLAAAVVVVCLVSLFGVLYTRGVDVGAVANAVHEVAPAAP